MAVKGLDNVLANLGREIKKIENATHAGVLEAALFIKGEAQEITPQDKGPLINSAFTDSEQEDGRATSRVGYTAEYAAIVHEMPDPYLPKVKLKGTRKGSRRKALGPVMLMGTVIRKKRKKSISLPGPVRARRGFKQARSGPQSVKWTKPGTGNKFLEKPFREHQHEVLEIIKDAAKIQ